MEKLFCSELLIELKIARIHTLVRRGHVGDEDKAQITLFLKDIKEMSANNYISVEHQQSLYSLIESLKTHHIDIDGNHVHKKETNPPHSDAPNAGEDAGHVDDHTLSALLTETHSILHLIYARVKVNTK